MSGHAGRPPGVRVRRTSIDVPVPAPAAAVIPGAGPVAGGVGGHDGAPSSNRAVAPPRLARHRLVLPSGREVGLALCGEGVPLVVVHGFGGEGILYAQTLSRLVGMGFKVLALDAPGHGRTAAIPLGSGFDRYASLVIETLDHLGIEQAIFVGHSMGGRVVAEVAAAHPRRVVALVLVDAIVGETWDRMVGLFRLAPALYAGFGVGLMADIATTLPVVRDPRQAMKLARLLTPTGTGHLARPWRLAGPVLTIVGATSSDRVLRRIRRHGLPTFVVHGDRDVFVPLCNARAAAASVGATLVTVHGARHSWLLSDPETFPAIVEDLRRDALGRAIEAARAAGAAQGAAADLDAVFYRPGAPVVALTPDPTPVPLRRRHRAPRYRWDATLSPTAASSP